ncbi:YwqG family protein [Nonomuraea rubra]|uniref:YwqG family protein n=1 Tax=Nonomuraea rubra TaxID=46180 RepID=UPI003402A500
MQWSDLLADPAEFARERLPAPVAELVIGLLRPGIHLHAAEEDEPVVGRLGGAALLPEDFPWPSSGTRPLRHIATLDCRALSSFEVDIALPRDGTLLFFVQEEGDRNQVIHLPAGTPAVARSEGERHPEIPLAGKTDVTWPGGAHPALAQALGSGAAVYERLWDVEWEGETFGTALSEYEAGRRKIHQVGGHAFVLQSPFEATAAHQVGAGWYGQESFYAEARQWVTLLQLDEDTDARMLWGDGAHVIWGIRARDLARLDFSQVCFDVQGH